MEFNIYRGLVGVIGLICALGFVSAESQAQEQRTKATPPEGLGTKVYHVLHLPENRQPSEKRSPVLVALTGYPAQLFGLDHWKLTTPTDTQRNGKPDEVTQPELQSFADPTCFYLSADRSAVCFRAHCGGVTTKGSSYPRSELRQMIAGGLQEADWSTDDKIIQEMVVEQAILALPDKKPHVVCAQIHDADDDLLMIRLEKKKLFIERPGQADVMLTADYELGTRFELRIVAGGGSVQVWFNGQQKLDWPIARAGCYFKVGCYTQSNTQRGDAPEAFAEVAVYRLQLVSSKQ